jgi:intraflagellar transport protein 88
MRNIGHSFVRLGQFHDAIDQYETVVNEGRCEASGYPDYTTAFNVLVCYYAVGASEKMRKGFARLLAVPQPKSYDEGDEDNDSETKMSDVAGSKMSTLP